MYGLNQIDVTRGKTSYKQCVYVNWPKKVLLKWAKTKRKCKKNSKNEWITCIDVKRFTRFTKISTCENLSHLNTFITWMRQHLWNVKHHFLFHLPYFTVSFSILFFCCLSISFLIFIHFTLLTHLLIFASFVILLSD